MKWYRKFFKKKPELEFEHIIKDVPFTSLIRWFIYDTGLLEPNEAAQVLGLTPVSEEGDDKEMEDSELRLQAIDDLMPYLTTMAELCATSLTKIQTYEIEEDGGELSQEEVSAMYSLYLVVSLSSLVSTFSSAVELGLVTKDTFISKTERLDIEDYGQ